MSIFSTRTDILPAAAGSCYTVTERENVPAEQWDGWLAESPGGGRVLQSHAWGEFKREQGWRPVRLLLQRDGEVAGAGQFLLRSTFPVPGKLMYCPKGPWIPWDDQPAVRAFFDGVVEAAKRRGAHTLKVEPEVPKHQGEHCTRVEELLRELGFRKPPQDVNHRSTILMDLRLSEEELLANMKKGTRYGVRRAAREGVRIVEDDSTEALELFWKMHEEMIERKGFWSRPRDYYASAWRVMEAAGRAHLFFAEHEGDRLAAAIVYTFGYKCIYMLGVSTREKSKLMPAELLQWEIMKWAKRRGIESYDLWGVPPPGELEEDHPLWGVYKFKAGFGGEFAAFPGCFDLPIGRTRAEAWRKFEPVHHRLYSRLKGDVFY